MVILKYSAILGVIICQCARLLSLLMNASFIPGFDTPCESCDYLCVAWLKMQSAR